MFNIGGGVVQVPWAGKGKWTNEICVRHHLISTSRCAKTIYIFESKTGAWHMMQWCSVNPRNQKEQMFLVLMSPIVVCGRFANRLIIIVVLVVAVFMTPKTNYSRLWRHQIILEDTRNLT